MDALLALFGLCLIFMVFFFPTMMAFARGHKNRPAILATNLLLGWTFIGWIIAMIWSCTDNTEANSKENT